MAQARSLRNRTVTQEQPGVSALLRREWAQAAIAVMAVLGVGVSIYLTLEHYAKAPLVCSASGLVDCAPVLKSAYSTLPQTQIPITLPGIAWFVVSGALALVALAARRQGRAQPGWLPQAQLLWSAAALAFVGYLIYGETQIKHICAWCTVVHVLTLLTFVLALAQLWRSTEAAGSARKASPSPVVERAPRPRTAPARAIPRRARSRAAARR